MNYGCHTPAELDVALREFMDCQPAKPVEKAAEEAGKFLEALLLGGPDGTTIDVLLSQDDGIQAESVADACCGHIFSEGELIYHCKECAVDETCVLCAQCFQSADHEKHDFRYYLSRGQGGSCDCGEAESWKMALTCPQHGVHSGGAGIDFDAQVIEPRTPSEQRLFERAQIFLPILAETIKKVILELVNSELLPSTGKSLPGGVPGCLTIINDEVHSFPEVISTFRRHLLVSEPDASQLAQLIDEQGFAVVWHFEADELAEAQVLLSRIGATGLQTLLLSRETVTGLRSLHAMLAFVLAGARKHPLLKRCAIELVSKTKLDLLEHSDLLSLCFIHDNHMMKWFKKSLQELFTLSLASQKAKINLMHCFTHYAGRLVMEMIEAPQLDYTHSLLHFSVQIFTVPSIAELACQTQGLTRIMAAVRSCMDRAQKCQVLSREATQGLGMLISILNYILTDTSVAQKGLLLTEAFYAQLCDCLGSFQNFKVCRRRLDEHVLYDDEDIVNIVTLMAHICELVDELAGSVSAPGRLLEMLKFVVDYANHRMLSDAHMNTPDCFSFQQPLLWLIGALLDRYALLSEGVLPDDGVCLGPAVVKGAARCVSILCQIEAGMWVRNGRTVIAQGAFCMRHMAIWREYMSICWHALASRSCSFSTLLHYLMIPQSLEAGEGDDESLGNPKYFKWLLEYAVLGLLYGMSPGLDSKTLIKAFLIRRLAPGPAPYSEVMDGLPDSLQKDTECGALLDEVACMQESETPFDPSLYRLRRGAAGRFNMFSIDLLEPIRTTALENMKGTYGFDPLTWILDRGTAEQPGDAQRRGLIADSDEDAAGLQLLVNGIAKVLDRGQFFVDLVALLAYFQRHHSQVKVEIDPMAREHIYAAITGLGEGDLSRQQRIIDLFRWGLLTFDQSRCGVKTGEGAQARSELALRKRQQVLAAFKSRQEQFESLNPDAQLDVDEGSHDPKECEMVLSGQCVYCQERADRDTEKYGVFGSADTLNLYQENALCLSSCLHLVHLSCFRKLRAARRRLCPLCESLGTRLFLVCPRPPSSSLCPDPVNFAYQEKDYHYPLASGNLDALIYQNSGGRRPSEFVEDYSQQQETLAEYSISRWRITANMSGWVQQYYLLQRLGGATREISHLERIRRFLNAHEDALLLAPTGDRLPTTGAAGTVGSMFAEYLFRNYSCQELTADTYGSILGVGRTMVLHRLMQVAFPGEDAPEALIGEEELYEGLLVDCAMVLGLVSLRFELDMPSFDDCLVRLFSPAVSADVASPREVISRLLRRDAWPQAPPSQKSRLPLGSIFINLPRDYQDLFLRTEADSAAERCKCGHGPRVHICLYCGQVYCSVIFCYANYSRHT